MPAKNSQMETVVLLGKSQPSSNFNTFAQKFGGVHYVVCKDNNETLEDIGNAKNIVTEMYFEDPNDTLDAMLLFVRLFQQHSNQRKRVFVHGYLNFIDAVKNVYQHTFNDIFKEMLDLADFYEVDVIFEPNEIRKMIYNKKGVITKSCAMSFCSMWELEEAISLLDNHPLEHVVY